MLRCVMWVRVEPYRLREKNNSMSPLQSLPFQPESRSRVRSETWIQVRCGEEDESEMMPKKASKM